LTRALAGQNALVTGGAQGLGSAIAARLAADGARVAVNDLEDDERLRKVVRDVDGLSAPADVSDRAALSSAVQRVLDETGGIDIAVCNAATMSMEPFGEHDHDAWWHQIDVNLTGTFNTIGAVLPSMLERGAGRVVVIASEWGVVGWPNATAYCASKAGLISLTKSLGRELAPQGVLVNAVAPGIIDTPQLEHDARDAGLDIEEMRRRYAETAPLRRIASPDEMAATVAFLCTPRAGAFVGQVLQPNGGTTRGPA
jgi:NAD(P)-dependent dehydrogenase (short-subunit alcohol dehydrogenase family)